LTQLVGKYFTITILLCFSITDPSTFVGTQAIQNTIASLIDRFPVILVGCKCDLSQQREVSSLEAKSLAELYGFEYIETSAKNGTNVSELFESIGKNIQAYKTKNISI